MTYDPNFDQSRLNMLAAQCLKDENIKGQVVFSGELQDSHIDNATPQFSDDDYASLKKLDLCHCL